MVRSPLGRKGRKSKDKKALIVHVMKVTNLESYVRIYILTYSPWLELRNDVEGIETGRERERERQERSMNFSKGAFQS